MKTTYTLQYQLGTSSVSRHNTLAAAAKEKAKTLRLCRKNGDIQDIIVEANEGNNRRRLTADESQDLYALEVTL